MEYDVIGQRPASLRDSTAALVFKHDVTDTDWNRL